MGVHNLWELLAPVGRRVSVETLAGKRLAIDASIWMVQFMKAMRDEKGDMVRNAHLIGFFRRICKLLYLRTKPVFVFDGGTPALKRRTVIARRRQRENAQAKIRKTAEKMLLNQLKAINLKELAKDLENQRRQQKNAVENDTKGKKIVLDDGDGSNSMQGKYERSKVEVTKDHQEKLDEMLAAAIAAEEDGNLTYNASTSGAGILSEEENSEDEQMLLPAMHGNVDPAVLASLPPSMQLDLLVQMRERLMAENRQKYQKVKKAPEKFSELQIQAYLKTVAFRREIDQVQKTAAGRAVGGVQTSRIASEANREFIFSSSFTGDKQELASARGEENRQKQQHATQQHFSPTFVKSVGHVNPSGAATELNADEPRNPDENIEIYKDERGRLRIRNRHMGIPMTRDIQRNLALMKEKERTTRDPVSNTNEVDGWKNVSNIEDAEAPPDIDDESSKLNDQTGNSMLKNASSLEISFEHIGENKNSIDDDDFFTQLVTGEPVTLCSGDNPPKEHSSPCASDSDWEEMPVERKDSGSNVDATIITDSIVQDGNMSHESEVEWEETPSADHRDFAVGGAAKAGSKSCLEEEAALREAIRRSLLDIDDKKPKLISSEFEGPMISGDAHVLENQRGVINPITENATQQKETSGRVGGEVEDKERSSRMSTSDRPISLTPELSDSCVASRLEQLKHDANEEIKLNKEIPSPESKTPLDRGLIVSDDRNELSLVSKRSMGGTSHSLDQVLGELPATHMVDEKNNDLVVETSVFISDKEDDSEVELEPQTIVDDNKKDLEPEPPNRTSEMMEPSNPFVEPSRKRPSSDVVMGQTSIAESSYKKISSGNNHKTESITVVDDETVQSKFTEADYEKEMENLNEEFLSLGDEQRRLERNAESVSSEMFAECQELLQIFGLPYIIAPMEAEAQCAFMELSDLVDGVVTDDSDVFLFGGRSIYKNIFDDRKYVETYFMKDIEKELGLNREKLIHMALLLGSDYTEGISGIGVVNAIEVVNAFPEEDGLKKFREWVESPDPAILGKADRQSGFSLKKRGSMAGDAGGISADDMQDIKQIFMDKHRNVSKNWHIPSTFPSEAVVSAYASPQVDQSTEPFSWGKPDLLVLRKLCWEKFSWNGQKTDDLLLPVLKEYEKRETQLRMEAFYSFNERFAKIRSKRIEKAVKGITGDNLSNLTDENLQKASRKRKRKVRTHANEDNQSDKESTKVKGSEGIQDIPMEKATSKRMRKGGNKEKQNSKRISVGNKRGRGSGKGKHDLQFASSENSSDDGIGSNEGKSFHDEDPVQPQSVRRSARSRNPVNYIVDERAGDVDFCENAISHDKSDVLGGIEDEVADPSVDLKGKKRLEGKDIVFEGRLSGDYDQTAGESCANEAETGGGSMNHNGDPDMEIENREDYLTMGGGFCMEESETTEIKDAADETTCSVEGDDSLYGIDSMDRPNSEIGLGGSTSDLGRGLQRHGNAHKSDESLSEDSVLLRDVKTYTGTPTTGTLSAMPFLKRKKRR